MKHVVIAGGGFAGLKAARKLSKNKLVNVTLINSSSDFRYSPALYRAATGFKMGTARVPLEWALIDSEVSLVIDSVINIDKERRLITLQNGRTVHYDYAVFALGAVTSFFGIPGLEDLSYGIKTPEEVKALKSHIHEKLTDNSASENNYVIVGAGPTGVELAGAIGSYLRHISTKHKVKSNHIKVYLVEAGPRILPQMSARSAAKAHKHLLKLNVEILCDTKVSSENTQSLMTSRGSIKTHNVIWTAGTANNPFYKNQIDIFKLDQRGKVLVDSHLQSWSNVYVIGDSASTKYSGLAMTAVSHGVFIAKDISAKLKGKKRPKKYETLPLQIVPAGEKWSVLQYGKLTITGKLASMMRHFADFVGYAEALGFVKALTIWSNSHRQEEDCDICLTR